jgi:hypothetical protein
LAADAGLKAGSSTLLTLHPSFARNTVIFPPVAARIAGPFEFMGKLIKCLSWLRGSALKDDFRGMAFGTADCNLVEFLK